MRRRTTLGSKVSKKNNRQVPVDTYVPRTGIAPVTRLAAPDALCRSRSMCGHRMVRTTAVHYRERLSPLTLGVERAEIYCTERFAHWIAKARCRSSRLSLIALWRMQYLMRRFRRSAMTVQPPSNIGFPGSSIARRWRMDTISCGNMPPSGLVRKARRAVRTSKPVAGSRPR